VGKEQGKAFVTEGIQQDTVFTYMVGSGTKYAGIKKAGINCAGLIKLAVSDVTAMVVHTSGVSISKA
jgi:hypothetical protein